MATTTSISRALEKIADTLDPQEDIPGSLPHQSRQQ